MRKLFFLIFFFVSSLCFADSELTLSGNTASPHLISVSGDTLTPRPYLDFEGNVTGANIGGKSIITIGSGGGSSGSSLWQTGNVGINTFNFVGINTTNPQANLEINDNDTYPLENWAGTNYTTTAHISSLGHLYFTGNGPDGNAIGINVLTGIQDQEQYLSYGDSPTLGSVEIGDINNHDAGNYIHIPQLGANTFEVGNMNVGLFFTVAYGGEIQTLNNILDTSTGGAYFLGNVGIGSIAPGQILDVQGTIQTTGFKMPTGASNTYVMTSDANGNGAWQPSSGGSGSNYWLLNQGGNVGISTTNNVGIGTFGFDRNLTVASSGSFAGVEFNNLNGGQKWSFGSIGNGSSFVVGSGLFFDQSTSKAAWIVLPSSDNVGIGTSYPNAALEVGNHWLDVTNIGNIGIGSALPGQMLDVKGTARILGNLDVNSNVGIGTTVLPSTLNINGNLVVGSGYAGVKQATSNGIIVVGDIGIGTFNPLTTLDVGAGIINNGNIEPITNGSMNINTNVSIGANTVIGESANKTVTLQGTQIELFGTNGVFTAYNTLDDGLGSLTVTGSGTNNFINGNTIFGSGTQINLGEAYMLATANSGEYAGYTTLCDFSNFSCNGDSIDFLEDNAGTGGWSFQLLTQGGSLALLDRPNGTNTLQINHGNGDGALTVQGGIQTSEATSANGTLQVYSDFQQGVNNAQIIAGGYNNPTLQLQIGFDDTVNRGVINAINQGVGSEPLALNSYGGEVYTGNLSGTVDNILDFGNGNSNAAFAGNVGINSIAPGSKLDVQGTARIFGNVGIGSALPGSRLDVQGTVRSTLGFVSGSNCFYYCNGGVDLGVLSRGSSCLCPGGTCVATNICSN